MSDAPDSISTGSAKVYLATDPNALAARIGEIAGRCSLERDREAIIEAAAYLRAAAQAKQDYGALVDRVRWALCAASGGAGKGGCSDNCACLVDAQVAVDTIVPSLPAVNKGEAPRNDDAIIFWYRNYKGEEGYRRVIPISLRFGKTEWHPEDQWLLLGYDTEKKAEREFALADAKNTVGPTRTEFATPQPASNAGGEIRQHIGWLKQYVQGMTAENWQDMRLRAERQLEQLSLGVSDLAYTWQDISTAPKERWIIGYTSWGQQVGKFHEHVGPCEWITDHFEFTNTDFDVFPLPTHWQPWPTAMGPVVPSTQREGEA